MGVSGRGGRGSKEEGLGCLFEAGFDNLVEGERQLSELWWAGR